MHTKKHAFRQYFLLRTNNTFIPFRLYKSGVIILFILALAACRTSKTTTTPTAGSRNTPVTTNPVSKQAAQGRTDEELEKILKKYPQYFNHILKYYDSLKVQIIYTRIDRQADNTPVFKKFSFNVDENNYFYPASTVKLPVAAICLQKANELQRYGINKYTSLITEAGYKNQAPVYNDPFTPNGNPSIAQYIKEALTGNDNEAYNRLYEFAGQEYLNNTLHNLGYKNALVSHRLQINMNDDEQRHTNPVQFISDNGTVLYNQPMAVSKLKYKTKNAYVGQGYFTYGQGELVNRPMDFSAKNNISLDDLDAMLKAIMFPASVKEQARFGLTATDYQYLWQYMSQFPRETTYPFYTGYRDNFSKYLLYGNNKANQSQSVRIFNKSGRAYGFITDVAYIADFNNNIEFMLCATIYCNSDGLLNDENYEYETVGLPFMQHLGQVIYDYELKRERKHKPDLKEFKLSYDK